jgi:stress-induced morphogen
MIEPQEIEKRIRDAMPDAQVVVKDLTGGRDHYEVEVVSAAFAGLGSLQRHRKVYAIFADVVGGALHALSLKTRAPGES